MTRILSSLAVSVASLALCAAPTTAQSATDAPEARLQQVTWSFDANCQAKCNDDQCRYFSCSGAVSASTEFEARIKAEAELKAEVRSSGGKTETMFSVNIRVSKK